MKLLFLTISILISAFAICQMDIVLQTGNTGTIYELEFHRSKKLLLSSDNQRVVIWDIQQRKQFASIDFNVDISNSGFISESKVYISHSNQLEIWDFYTRELLYTHNANGIIKSVQATQNELYILSGNLEKLSIPSFITEKIELSNHQLVNDIKISEDGKLIGLVTDNNYLVYNLQSLSLTFTIKIKNVLASYISNSAKNISIAVSPSSIHTYSFKEDKIEKKNVITNDRSWNNYSSIYLTERYGFSGDSKDVITTYNTNKGKIISFKKNNSESISKITSNSDHSIIAIGGENGLIKLYDNAFNLFHTLKPISPIPTCIELLDDSTNIIIGYDNGEIKKWNINTHQVETLPNSLKKSIKKKKLEIISINKGEGILKSSWKSNITNNSKNDYHRIIFDDLYSTYSIEKIDNYTVTDITHRLKTNKDTLIELHNGETITAISNTTLNDNYLVGSSSGFIYLINNQGEEILKMVSPTSKSFFYTTPDNYYYASKSALQHIGARYKSQLIGFEQIDLVYNRPDKIIPLISPYCSDEYISLLSQAYSKRLKKLNITTTNFEDLINLPILETNLNQLPTNTKQKEIKINVSVHDSGSNLKALHILINDSPIYGKSGLTIDSKKEYTQQLTLALSQGSNKIQIFVENEFGTKSLRQKTSINSNYSVQPTLHLLTIGSGTFIDSDYNLKYAAKDANDMSLLFQKTKQFKDIKTNTLTGENVNLREINKAVENLESATINDVVIIFFAGHGVLDQNLDYYLSSYNMNFNNPSENGINFDDFENKLSELKCRHKLLLIDACHSGELDKDEIEEVNQTQDSEQELIVFRSGQKSVELIGGKSAFELSKNIFIDLRTNSGVITISSAGAAEYALEGEKWKNGAFTYCLLKGIINFDADLNKNKKISTNELQQYLFMEVPKLTNGRQTPTSRVELMEQNFIVW